MQRRFDILLADLAAKTKDSLCAAQHVFHPETWACMADVEKAGRLLRDMHGGSYKWLLKNEALLWALAIHTLVQVDFDRYEAVYQPHDDYEVLTRLSDATAALAEWGTSAMRTTIASRYEDAAARLDLRQYRKFAALEKSVTARHAWTLSGGHHECPITQLQCHVPIVWQPLQFPTDLADMVGDAAQVLCARARARVCVLRASSTINQAVSLLLPCGVFLLSLNLKLAVSRPARALLLS